MIFFNEKKLARKLHEGHVTEKEQMIYLSLYVTTCVFFTLMVVNHEAYYESSINVYSYLFDFVTFAFTLGTLIYCSAINRLADGKDTIARYICLSVAITVKFTPLLLILACVGSSLDNFSNIYSLMTEDSISAVQMANPQEVDASLYKPYQEGPFLVLLYIFYSLLLLWRYKAAFEIASGKVELK